MSSSQDIEKEIPSKKPSQRKNGCVWKVSSVTLIEVRGCNISVVILPLTPCAELSVTIWITQVT